MSGYAFKSKSTGAPLLSTLAFTRISGLIRAHCGISISDDKSELLASRLRPLLREGGYSNFDDFYDAVLKDPSDEDLGHLVDVIATNYTYFFREQEHFDFLTSTALPELRRGLERYGQLDLRIWSAACSTGEEPYSIRMCLQQFFGDAYSEWQAGVLATDISTTALATATRATYSESQLKRVPHHLRTVYFGGASGPPGTFCFRQEHREDVVFRRLNLHAAELPFRKPMHIVFCRNVLLYFDQAGRGFLESRLYDLLADDGFLVIGLTEALQTGDQLFEHVAHGVFRRRRSPQR